MARSLELGGTVTVSLYRTVLSAEFSGSSASRADVDVNTDQPTDNGTYDLRSKSTAQLADKVSQPISCAVMLPQVKKI